MGIINLDKYEKQTKEFEFRGKKYYMVNDLSVALKVMNEFNQTQDPSKVDIGQEVEVMDRVFEVALSNYDRELKELSIAGKNVLLENILAVATGMTVEEVKAKAEENFTRTLAKLTNSGASV